MKSQRFKKQLNNKTESESCLLCCHKLSINIENVFDTRFGIHTAFGIAKCLSCDLEYTVPLITPKKLKKLYKKYYNFGGEKSTAYTRLREKFLSSSIYCLWLVIDGDISFHCKKGQGRLLDVGCNEGRGLKIYQRNGYIAEGLEPNETAAKEARKAGFRIYADSLEKFEPEKLYDVIVLSNVIEHSLDPKVMLYHVGRLLKPGGQIWISCPNMNSWQRKFFGRYWINWHVPFHIVHFSQISLLNILIETDFEIQEIRQESPALWVTHSVIVRLFAKSGRPTKQLRNPFWVAFLLILTRILFFPFLWLENRMGRGDCIIAIAIKKNK